MTSNSSRRITRSTNHSSPGSNSSTRSPRKDTPMHACISERDNAINVFTGKPDTAINGCRPLRAILRSMDESP